MWFFPEMPILTGLIPLLLVILLPWLILADTKAEPVVVYDSGKLQPINEFTLHPSAPNPSLRSP